MGATMREYDWSASPIGPPDAWSQALRSAVSMMLANKHLMFIAWGPDLAFLYNDGYRPVFGKKHPWALGRPFREVWSEIWDDIVPLIDAALSGKATWSENLPLVMERNGYPEDCWFTFSYSPLRDESGEIVGLFCAGTETTAAVLLERRLAAERKRQQHLFAQAPGFITVLDGPELRFEFVNDAYKRLFGNRDYIGRTVREVFPDLEDQVFFELLESTYATGKRHVARNIPIRLQPTPDVPADGRFLDFIYEPVTNEGGTVTGLFIEGYDVTEQARATAALRASEERFRVFAQCVPTHVWSSRPDGYVDWFNDQVYAYTGHEPGTLLGSGWAQTVHPDDLAEATETWSRAIATGEPPEMRFRIRGEHGGYRHFLVRAQPVKSADGQIELWVGTHMDIDNETRLAIKFADLNANLQRQVANRTRKLVASEAALHQSQKLEALGQLTSGIAHDFNNILAAIAGGLAMIETRVDDAFVLNIAKQCKDAAFRGAKLIKQMLGFARQEVLAPVLLDLAFLANDLEPLINQAIPGNIVTFDFQPDLPKVTVDPVLLETALLNLAVNARDAMPGGGKLLISARRSNAGERGRPVELATDEAVAISVRDNGTGMAPEVLQRVTEPFFTTKDPGKGTGLGLSMVHGFAAQSGGAMRIESCPGKGTTITLYLPVISHGADQPIQDTTGIVSVLTGTGTVLLVDDDPGVRAVTAAQLREFGYAVTEARGHDAALAELDSGVKFDCVVSDVVMPGGDGITLARAIRARHRDLPIMFITGRADSDRVAGEIVLQKPFTVADLSQAVAHNLERAVSERETLAKIASRAHSQCLKEMLNHWANARAVAQTPLFASFDPELCAEPRNLVVMKADPSHLPMRLQFLSAGEELEALLGRSLAGTELDVRGSDGLGSVEESYRRSIKTSLPVYDYTRINLGDGQIEMFERLILPHSSDGRMTDRLVAIIMLNRLSAT